MPIGKPAFDMRPGVVASATARLWICATICILQYWLLAASLEAHHSGNHRIAVPAFAASAACFLLVAGLIVTGERGSRKLQGDLKEPGRPRDAR